MRYNSRGDLAAGGAAGILSINRVVIGEGQGPKWRDDDRLIANAQCGGKLGLYEFRRDADFWQPTILDTRLARTLAAGGGSYLATAHPYATFGALGRMEAPPRDPLVQCHALDAAGDGSILAMSPDCGLIIVRWDDGTIEEHVPAAGWHPGTARIVNSGFFYATTERVICYQPRGRYELRHVEACEAALDVGTFVDRANVRWWWYRNTATYLHREGLPAGGYEFPRHWGVDVWYDAVANAAHVALVANDDELPEDITVETVILGLGERVLCGR